jgi:hypothetical protein
MGRNEMPPLAVMDRDQMERDSHNLLTLPVKWEITSWKKFRRVQRTQSSRKIIHPVHEGEKEPFIEMLG